MCRDLSAGSGVSPSPSPAGTSSTGTTTRFDHETRYLWAYRGPSLVGPYSLSTAAPARRRLPECRCPAAPLASLVASDCADRDTARQVNPDLPVLDPHRRHRAPRPRREVLNTPRTTGSTTAQTAGIDRNHGSDPHPVWDRLFGTFQRRDPDDPVIYGLTKNIRSRSTRCASPTTSTSTSSATSPTRQLARPPLVPSSAPGLGLRPPPSSTPTTSRAT